MTQFIYDSGDQWSTLFVAKGKVIKLSQNVTFTKMEVMLYGLMHEKGWGKKFEFFFATFWA